MTDDRYATPGKILERARGAIGKKIKDIDRTGRLSTGKGAIGTIIEESWFDYRPNSDAEPDFPEAGVELKVTPYRRTSKGAISAKERLVCNIIDYMSEPEKTFETSSFWHKCKKMLIMAYEYRQGVDKGEFSIEAAELFEFTEEDKEIIKKDWETIIAKIRAGQAHLLTEGETLYLAACTKGKDSTSTRQQPYSPIPAKQRAYSLKSTFMTRILRNFISGEISCEKIITDVDDIRRMSLEEMIHVKVRGYIGKTQRELKEMFGISTDPKNLNMIIFSRMIGLRGDAEDAQEFEDANIVPKTICLEKNNNLELSNQVQRFFEVNFIRCFPTQTFTRS